MIRVRFKARGGDHRPMSHSGKHPFWGTGYGDHAEGTYATVVAYADDEAEILRNWPDAYDLESTEVTSYQFSDRFPKPDWWLEP